MTVKPSRYAQSRKAIKQETRQALLDAAATVLAREGLDASLDDICAEAGRTRGAFYVHFDNREDLLAQVVERTGAGLLNHLLGPEEQEPVADLSALAARFIQALQQGELPSSAQNGIRFHQFLGACARSPRIRRQYQNNMARARARISKILKQLQQQNSLRTDVDPDALAAVVMTLVVGAQVFDDMAVEIPIEAGAKVLLRTLMPAT